MSRVFDLSSSFVDRSAALDPFLASRLGIAGSEGEVPDFSPAGLESRLALIGSTLEDLGSEQVLSAPERVASDVLRDKLATELALHEAGDAESGPRRRTPRSTSKRGTEMRSPWETWALDNSSASWPF